MSSLDRQYVQCCFSGKRDRLYTYHFDGEPRLQVGETVRVEARDGNGWVRIEVVTIDQPFALNFNTKPVFRPEDASNPTLFSSGAN